MADADKADDRRDDEELEEDLRSDLDEVGRQKPLEDNAPVDLERVVDYDHPPGLSEA